MSNYENQIKQLCQIVERKQLMGEKSGVIYVNRKFYDYYKLKHKNDKFAEFKLVVK